MRSAIFLLVSSCCLALLPGVCRAASDNPGQDLIELQDVLESEFAFQSGNFTQASAFYKSRPLGGLGSAELVRAGQMAIAAGDTAWLRQILASAGASRLQELSEFRLAEALRSNNDLAAWAAWRDMLAQPQGIESGRQVIESHARHYRPALERTLALYAKAPDLSDGERDELFLYAIQWQQDAVADQLLTEISKADGKRRIAELVHACLRNAKPQCLAGIEALQPMDFDELQRRTILSVARRQGFDLQSYRWMMAMPQDSGSYYQRVLQLGRQYDQARSAALTADLERDAGLTHFQRAALLGSVAELRKDWPAAETHYREALDQDSPTTACIRLAVVLFRQNRKSEALQVLADTQRDETLSDEIRREAFFTEIQFLQISGLDAKASATAMNDIFQRALVAWPLAHRIRYQYAMRLLGQEKVEQALDELEAVLRTAPADVDALNAYGYTLAKEMNRPGTAFKPLQKAYLIAPNRAEVLDSYGYVLHRLGRNSQALPPLQKAWETTPSAVTAGHLVKVYWQLGDKRQAQDYLDKGLELDAQESELIKLKELLP